MLDTGFITLHRKLLDNPVFQKPELLQLFVLLLFKANWQDKTTIFNGKTMTVKRGQCITGRHALAQELRQKPRTVYDRLLLLKELQIINIESNNKFSLITIVKYSDYQDIKEKTNSKSNNKPTTSQQPANNQPTHLNKDNNINNETNITPAAQVADPVNLVLKEFYDTINPNINFANKSNRDAAKWLVDKHGLEKVLNAIRFAVAIQGQQFAPVITTPTELKNKMAALVIYQQRKVSEPAKGIRI